MFPSLKLNYNHIFNSEHSHKRRCQHFKIFNNFQTTFTARSINLDIQNAFRLRPHKNRCSNFFILVLSEFNALSVLNLKLYVVE